MAYYAKSRCDVFVDGVEVSYPQNIVSVVCKYGVSSFIGNLPTGIGEYASAHSLGDGFSVRALIEATITGEYDFASWTLETFSYDKTSEERPDQRLESLTNPSANSISSGFLLSSSLIGATSSSKAALLHFRLYLISRHVVKTITLNPNGGTVSPTSVECVDTYANAVDVTPTWDDLHYFVGWYSELTGGYSIKRTTVLDDDSPTTIYARWSESPAPPPAPEGAGTLVYDTVSGRLLFTASGNLASKMSI